MFAPWPIGSMYGIFANIGGYIDGIHVSIYSSTMDPLGDSLHTNQQKHILRANPIPCTWKVWDLRPSRALFHLSCRRFLVDFFEDMGWSLPTYLDPQKYHHKMVKVLKSWGKTSFFGGFCGYKRRNKRYLGGLLIAFEWLEVGRMVQSLKGEVGPGWGLASCWV